jgi:hypothetical protein
VNQAESAEPSGVKPAHPAPDPPTRDIVALLRDLTLPVTLFLYVIGFSYRAHYLEDLNVPVTFAGESPINFVYWAEQAWRGANYWPYVAAMLYIALFLALAMFIRSSQGWNLFWQRLTIFSLIGVALVTGIPLLIAISNYAADRVSGAQTGSQHLIGSALQNQIFLRLGSAIPNDPLQGCVDSGSRACFYVTQTPGEYEIIMREKSISQPKQKSIAIAKGAVTYYEFAPTPDPLTPDASTPAPHNPQATGIPPPSAHQLFGQ